MMKVVENDASRKGYPHSYIEGLWDDMYLEGRWSLPVNSNPYLALKTPPKHSAVPPGSDPQIVGATRYVDGSTKGEFFLHGGSGSCEGLRCCCTSSVGVAHRRI